MLKKYLNYLYKKAESDKINDIRQALSKLPSGGILLDVGCWDGINSLKWADALKAKKIIGLEVVKKVLPKAKKLGIEVYDIDLDKEKWPIIYNTIDYVVSNLVIEHLTNVDHFISESERVLRKGGYTIVSSNNLSSWHNIFSLLSGWTPFDLTCSSSRVWSLGNPLAIHNMKSSYYGSTFTHKCVYTIRWLREWYQLYNFELVEVYGAGYYPLPSVFAKIDKNHSAFITLVFKKK